MQLNEERRIQPLLFENGDVAVFVSGSQGLIVITSTEEVIDVIRFENNQVPVYTLAELVTPMDFFMPKVTIQS